MSGVSSWDAGLSIAANLSACRHQATAVESFVTGEVVAALCRVCLLELPVSWLPPPPRCADCEWVEIERLLCGDPVVVRTKMCAACEEATRGNT